LIARNPRSDSSEKNRRTIMGCSRPLRTSLVEQVFHHFEQHAGLLVVQYRRVGRVGVAAEHRALDVGEGLSGSAICRTSFSWSNTRNLPVRPFQERGLHGAPAQLAKALKQPEE
jgi:hypothetical protein